MTATYRVSWLLLPQGRSDDVVNLTALATFRLTPGADQTLNGFPQLLDWPALVDPAAIHVHFNGAAEPVPATRRPTLADTPPATAGEDEAGEFGTTGSPSEWWRAMFVGSTPVRAWQQDTLPADDDLRSYDQAAAATNIANLYTPHLTKAAMPTYAEVAPTVGLTVRGSTAKGEEAAPLVADLNRWLSGALPGKGEMPTDPQKVTDAIDFHQRVSSLDQLPALLQHLRIAVPLTVPAAALPAEAEFTGWVTVGLPDDAQRENEPPTRTRIEPRRFLPARGPVMSTADGFLTMAAKAAGVPPRGSLVTVDVEGAVVKLAGMLSTADALASSDGSVTLLAGKGRQGTTVPAGLPALRVQGMSLALTGQEDAARLSGAAAAKLAADSVSGAEVVLDSDALTTGWRVDVEDQGLLGRSTAGMFRSLHARTTTVKVLSTEAACELRTADEGAVVEAGTRQGVGEEEQPTMTIPPALAVWKGWSLSVPAPWLVVAADQQPGSEVEEAPNDPLGSLPIDITFPAAVGLPRLRYGHVYAARARGVDASGWSLPLQEVTPSDDAVTRPAPFLRLDPVPPPVTSYVIDTDLVDGVARTLGHLEGPQAGESVDRLAVRSYANDPDHVVRVARRLAAPPRTTFETAERHGLLDVAITDEDARTKRYNLFFERDRSTGDGQPLGLPASPVALEYVADEAQTLSVPPPPPNSLGTTNGQGGSDQPPKPPVQNVTAPLDALPYLPDPLAGRVRAWLEPIRTLSSTPKLAIGNWPAYRRPGVAWEDARPFLVVLERGAGRTNLRVDQSGPVDRLVVSLLPGEACRLHLAGIVENTEQARLFQLVQWAIDSGLSPARAAALVTQCSHWMITPTRTLECVHAVEMPLVKPAIVHRGARLTLHREQRSRHAQLTFQTPCHVNSTGRLEVLADWTDPAPDGVVGQDPVVDRHSSAGVFDRTVDDHPAGSKAPGPASTISLPMSGIHPLPDTRYRRVTYQVVASSRYREYMPPRIRTAGMGSSSGRPGPENPLQLERPMSIVSDPVEGFVPSSTPPPPPVLGPVLPAFTWTGGGDPHNGKWRRRSGRTLRVDLGSRWFETGFNEMLAVVVASTQRQNSEWGDDPLYGGPLPPKLTSNRFPLRRLSPTAGPDPAYFSASPAGAQHKLELNRCPRTSFITGVFAAHLVDYDAARGRWFCDVTVDAGAAYRPMIKLSLARWQPFSLFEDKKLLGVSTDFGEALSKPALTDYLPLLPDRAVLLQHMFTPNVTGDTWGVRILGPHIATLEQRHRFTVKVQRLADGLSEDFGWVDNTGDPGPIGIPPQPGPLGKPGAGSGTLPGMSDEVPVPVELSDLNVIWSGMAGLGPKQPGFRYRLLITEEELNRVGEDPRLVYFDTVEI